MDLESRHNPSVTSLSDIREASGAEQPSFAHDILLVSTADWDNPYWTNKQHMALQFAGLGCRLLYVESQGLRAPTATGRDLRRIWARLRRGLRPPREVRPNVHVWSPLVIPFQASAAVRRLNRWLLRLGVGFWSARLGLKPRLLWTYSPLTTELYDTSAYELMVYHAVDDIKAQPGMPRETIEAAESALVRRADLVFTTAPHLQQTHRAANPATYYFPNVADFDHFVTALASDTQVPTDLLAIPGPRIGFVGAISSYKLDFELVRTLALARPQWSFVFIGEIGEGDPHTDPAIFDGISNLHFLGGRPYASLPGYLKGMSVVLQPNRLNDYTRSMFPMKFFEYLAAGRQIVSTRLPALAGYERVARFCDDAPSFLMAIECALDDAHASLEERLAVAREQTYAARTAKMVTLVDEQLRGRAPDVVPARAPLAAAGASR